MTSGGYKSARTLRGSQTAVAAQLGVRQATVSDRETGAMPITREAWLALNALPKKRKRKGPVCKCDCVQCVSNGIHCGSPACYGRV